MRWLPDWLTGFDRDAYNEGLEADRRNKAITDDLRNKGLITEDDYNVAIGHYSEADKYDPDAEITDAFNQQLSKETSAVRDFGTGAINATLKGVLGSIPWQVYVGLAVYVAWRLGFFKGLLKKS